MTSRVLGAVLCISAVSLLSVGRLFTQVLDFYPTAPAEDNVTSFDKRFVELRAMLPAKGVIGYMTDAGKDSNATTADAEFYLTQYALAPVIVLRSPDQKYVVGNFHQVVTTGSLRDRGFKLVRQFGNGIALLENEKVQ